MASEILVAGHRYWIVSEPTATGWRASVLEVLDLDGLKTRELGIQATGDTRSAADQAAVGELQRYLRDA